MKSLRHYKVENVMSYHTVLESPSETFIFKVTYNHGLFFGKQLQVQIRIDFNLLNTKLKKSAILANILYINNEILSFIGEVLLELQ